MSSMFERLAKAVNHARKVKENHVRDVKGRKGRTDILTIVEAWRGDEVVAAAFAPPDRDLALHIAQLFCRGLSADMIVMVMETYQGIGKAGVEFLTDDEDALLPNNPDTGKEWGQGELGAYFEKHGQDNGVVSEALWITAFNRAGDELGQGLMYRLDGRKVEWTRDTEPMGNLTEEGGRSEGIVPDAMRSFMQEVTILDKMGAAYFDLGPDEESRQAVADSMTIKALEHALTEEHPQLMAMVFATPGSKRHQIMRERFGRQMVQDPSQWN